MDRYHFERRQRERTMESIWSRDVKMPEFPTVTSDMKVEVLVIGGGMAGLLCGYFLKEQGVRYALIEKNTAAGGVTKNTTAKLTFHHGPIYSKLLKEFGQEKAAAYLAANSRALEEYRALAAEIPCDFVEKDNWIYSMGNHKAILDEVSAVDRLGGKAFYMERMEIPLKAACAVRTPEQGQFHPLKFAAAISRGQNIFEHSFAGDIHKERYGYQVKVMNQLGRDIKINADRVIVATHFPYIDRWGMYFMKMHQQRSYVLALENPDGTKPQALGGMYIGIGSEEENPLNLSFRTFGNYLLLGGGGGRTGKKQAAWEELKQQGRKLYPKARTAAAWAAQDCMTLDDVPYIGPYAKGKDGLLVATGFNKWGMTGAMTAALALTGRMDSSLTEVFKPQRTSLRPQLALNFFETGKNFLRPTAPRCTHLGCALKWNSQEKTWDCPCHGSRFEEGGAVIDNPAQVDLKKREF